MVISQLRGFVSANIEPSCKTSNVIFIAFLLIKNLIHFHRTDKTLCTFTFRGLVEEFFCGYVPVQTTIRQQYFVLQKQFV